MNTAQLHGQRRHPVQEAGNEKAEPLLSIQQTYIDHPMDVMIDSSRLVMDNGNSPVVFIEDIFTRLTQRLVFEFLEGHARMEGLPCLGDLADGNDEFHRITPSPAFSKSSQFELLDSTGTLHPSSIIFMDSDFNPRIEDYLCESVLLDSYDAPSTTFLSSLEHFRSKLISQSADHIIEETHQCSPINNIVNEKIAGLMAESSCNSEIFECQVFMESDEFSNGIDFMSASIPVPSNQSDKENSKNPVSKTAYPEDGHNIFDITVIDISEIHNSSVNASIIHSTSDWDSVSSMSSINLGHSCNDKFGYSNKLLATVSTNESSPIFSIPDSEQLNEFLYGNLKFPMFLASGFQDEKLDTFDYPSLPEDTDSVADKDVADLSDIKFYDQFIDAICNYDKKTSDTPGVLIGLENGLSSGERKEMEISNSSNTELLATFWHTVVDSSSFDVSDHQELLESYELNNQDEYNDTDYTCASPIWPGKVDAAWKEAIRVNLTDFDLNKDSLSSFYDENSRNSVSSTQLKQRKCAFNTSALYDSSEDYLSQGHPFNDGFRNSIEEPIIGTAKKSLVYAMPNPNTLNDYLHGSLKSPMFLASERMNMKFNRDDSPSFYAVCYSDDCGDVARPSDNCNVELIDSDCSSKDLIAFTFEFSDHYELLETYGLNIQDQYTDTGYSCKSPSWPGKSEGQIQKSLTFLATNLTEDEHPNGTPTADASLFHFNTDGIAVMNKKSTNKCYEENAENSVSLCHLNQMESAFETWSIDYDFGSTDCVHSCSGGFEDSIEHQYLKNDFKFALPDPSTLRDYLFGSLDSPKFLALELLGGEIDNLHYPSLFGDCEQGDRTEEADLSGKMILDQCSDFGSSKNDNSIYKFSCSIQLLDLTSSPFNISDQNELLERYGIDNLGQFMDGNWTCDSPTWPGKM